jgi:23S rRNA pseudouridine1911/1915/1917 synthase
VISVQGLYPRRFAAADKTRYPVAVDDPRSITVPQAQDGATLAAVVRDLYAQGISWSKARDLVGAGKVKVDGAAQLDSTVRIRAGAKVEVDPSARRRKPDVHAPGVALLYADHDLVVVRKPAGLLTVEFDGEDERDTLRDQATAALIEQQRKSPRTKGGANKRREYVRLGVVQRLDKDTSGVLVFPRTEAARRELANQFRAHTIERRYLALVWGRAEAATHDTWLIQDRGDGRRGSWRGPNPPPAAKRAITRTQVERRLTGPFGEVTLISCGIETGRQHQIRIHLAESGHPLLGERVYDREHATRPVQAERVMLHAAVLGFDHPSKGQPMRFEDPPPADFEALLAQLGAGPSKS